MTKSIIKSDALLDMPSTTQNLYFHMLFDADKGINMNRFSLRDITERVNENFTYAQLDKAYTELYDYFTCYEKATMSYFRWNDFNSTVCFFRAEEGKQVDAYDYFSFCTAAIIDMCCKNYNKVAQRGKVPFETVLAAVADAFAKRNGGTLKVL